MANPKRGPGGVLEANSLRTTMCKHGTLTLFLLDGRGEVFATAKFDAAGSADLMTDIGEKLEAFLKASGLWVESGDAPAPSDGQVH